MLYDENYNTNQLYVILFGKLKLTDQNSVQIGQTLNIGWTAGEEILFKQVRKDDKGGEKRIVHKRTDRCTSTTDSCVLGFEKKALRLIKMQLEEKGLKEEFRKLEVVIRGNYLVKKGWR